MGLSVVFYGDFAARVALVLRESSSAVTNHLDVGSTCDTLCTTGLFRRGLSPHGSRVHVVPTRTDINGNGAALRKPMTSTFPASAVITELPLTQRRWECVPLSTGRLEQPIKRQMGVQMGSAPPSSRSTSLMYNPTHCNAIFHQMQSNLDARRRRPTRRPTWKASCPTSARSRSEVKETRKQTKTFRSLVRSGASCNSWKLWSTSFVILTTSLSLYHIIFSVPGSF